jgi:hypothetical protein
MSAQTVAAQAVMLEEFLAREAAAGRLAALTPAAVAAATQPLLVHGHCHQKAFGGSQPGAGSAAS